MNGKLLLEGLGSVSVRVFRWGTVVSLLWLFLVLPPTRAQQGALMGLKIPLQNITFIGNKSFASDDLKAIFRSAGTVTAQLSPQSMDTYNNDRIVHASKMLLAFYRNSGFLKAVVHPVEFDLGPSGSATMSRWSCGGSPTSSYWPFFLVGSRSTRFSTDLKGSF